MADSRQQALSSNPSVTLLECKFGQPESKSDTSLPSRSGFQSTFARRVSPEYTTVDQLDEDIFERQSDEITTWRPAYLQRRVLLLFFVAFLILLASVETIYQISQRQSGLLTSVQSRHYLWTYGPTSVLSIVGALWARVVYQSRQSAPWAAMSDRHPVDASKSILLDYLSMFEIGVLYAAMRNGNYLVVASSIIGWLLKIGIVFSTGLIALYAQRVHRDNVPITLLTSFSYSPGNLSDVGTAPFFTNRGILGNDFSYPEGSDSRFAFQRFEGPSSLPPNSILEATVDGFSADLDCESGELIVNQFLTHGPDYVDEESPFTIQDLTFSSPSCNISGLTTLSDSTFNHWVMLQPGSCGAENTTESLRVVLSAGKVAQGEPNITVDGYERLYSETTVVRSTVLICKPTYTIANLDITVNNTKSSGNVINVTFSRQERERALDGLHGGHISQSYFNVFHNVRKQMGHIYYSDPWYDLGLPRPMIYIPPTGGIIMDLHMALGVALGTNHPGLSQVFHADTLKECALRAYHAITAQIAYEFLVVDSPSASTGSATLTENRLVVRILSVRVMEALFALMAALTCLILFLTYPSGTAVGGPSTLLGLAGILSRGGKLVDLLKGTGSLDIGILQRRLTSYLIQTSHSTNEKIQISNRACGEMEGSSEDLLALGSEVAETEWWQPFPIRAVGYFSACLGLSLLIALLEGILRLSQRNNGLGDTSPDSYVQYVWAYVPAMVMAGVGIYFMFLDWTVRCLAPYLKLRRGATIRQSLEINLLDKLSPNAIFEAARTRHWAILASTTAAIVGTFLTIAASSLFTAQRTINTRPVELQTLTLFPDDTRAVHNTNVGEGEFTAGLVLERDLPYPDWTYAEYVLQSLSLTRQSNKSTRGIADAVGTSIVAKVPAVRTGYDCKVWDSSTFVVNLTWGGLLELQNEGTYRNPLVVISPDEACGFSGIGNDLNFLNYWPFIVDIEQDGFFGRASRPTGSRSAGGSCSDFGYMWGKVVNRTVEHVQIMGCNQSLSQVQVDTRFLMPGFTIDPDNPPVADESTSRPYTPSPAGLSYEILPNSTNPNLDNFFSLLLRGEKFGPLQLSSLEDNPAALDQVKKKVKQTLSVIRALEIHTHTRTPTVWQNTEVFPSVLYDPYSILRVLQDAVSTRVLQGLLATLLACCIVVAVLMGRRGVVPKNPCSIAAMASLLADSNLLNEGVLPANLSQMSDRELSEVCGLGDWEAKMDFYDVVDVDSTDGDGDGDGDHRGFNGSKNGSNNATRRIFTIRVEKPAAEEV